MYKMSGINLMPLNKLARWLGFMFEAICLPRAKKVTGLSVGITHLWSQGDTCKCKKPKNRLIVEKVQLKMFPFLGKIIK